MGNPALLRRHLDTSVEAALSDTPVVLVVGPRQAGKTTLCEQIAGKRGARLLTFDDGATLAAAQSDPAGFVAALEGPVVLDEIQRAPELLSALKLAVDRNRKPGRFLLTGSANILTLPRASESLAGRMEVLTLWPLSQGEIASTRERFVDDLFTKTPFRARAAAGESRSALLERALRGGYPELLARKDPARRRAWFGSYVTTILQRDVRDIAQIDGLSELPRLLAFLASRSATLQNVAEVSRTTGLPQTTLTRYLALLENIFLIRRTPAWTGSRARRLVKTPRVVLTDTGLLAHLAGLTTARIAEDPTATGPLLETFVAGEIQKQLGWCEVHAELFHFRTAAGREVDLVLEADDGRVVGIEVKAAASVGVRDFRGLEALREVAGKRFHRGVLLYAGREVLPFGSEMWAVPMAGVWQAGGGGNKRP